jgi:SAM-dependent methyltransferase
MSVVKRATWRAGYEVQRARTVLENLFWSFTGIFARPGTPPAIRNFNGNEATLVDDFWGDHVVESTLFKSAWQSRRQLVWRASLYPLFTEFVNLYGRHEDEVVLDYGCGPGNDLVGYSIYSKARKIIGIDISEKALRLAQHRLSLHRVDPGRLELIRSSDDSEEIPLQDESVDFLQCLGVLHHTSHPQALLEEFHRILKPGGEARVMVYNRDSVWVHLFAAYEKLIIQNAFPGKDAYAIFHLTVDVEADGTGKCPIATCHNWKEFSQVCESNGFQAKYMGGYLSDVELRCMKKYLQPALKDERLGREHRNFLSALKLDTSGLPMYEGKHAGIGGVFKLVKK